MVSCPKDPLVYDREFLLKFRALDICQRRPFFIISDPSIILRPDKIIDLPWKRSEAPRPGINFAQWWSANRNVPAQSEKESSTPQGQPKESTCTDPLPAEMPKMPKQTNSNSYNRVSSVTYASSNMLNHKLPPGLQPITQQQFTQPPHFMSMQAGFQGQQQHSLYSGLFPFGIPSFPGNVQHHPLNWAPVPNMPPSNMRYPSNMVSNMVTTFPSNIPTFQHPPPPPPGYFKKQKPSGGEKSEVGADERGDSKCVTDTPAEVTSKAEKICSNDEVSEKTVKPIPDDLQQIKSKIDFEIETKFDKVKEKKFREIPVTFRRRSSSIRVGSTRLRRMSLPSRPIHPSMEGWPILENQHIFAEDVKHFEKTSSSKAVSKITEKPAIMDDQKPAIKVNLENVLKEECVDNELFHGTKKLQATLKSVFKILEKNNIDNNIATENVKNTSNIDDIKSGNTSINSSKELEGKTIPDLSLKKDFTPFSVDLKKTITKNTKTKEGTPLDNFEDAFTQLTSGMSNLDSFASLDIEKFFLDNDTTSTNFLSKSSNILDTKTGPSSILCSGQLFQDLILNGHSKIDVVDGENTEAPLSLFKDLSIVDNYSIQLENPSFSEEEEVSRNKKKSDSENLIEGTNNSKTDTSKNNRLEKPSDVINGNTTPPQNASLKNDNMKKKSYADGLDKMDIDDNENVNKNNVENIMTKTTTTHYQATSKNDTIPEVKKKSSVVKSEIHVVDQNKKSNLVKSEIHVVDQNKKSNLVKSEIHVVDQKKKSIFFKSEICVVDLKKKSNLVKSEIHVVDQNKKSNSFMSEICVVDQNKKSNLVKSEIHVVDLNKKSSVVESEVHIVDQNKKSNEMKSEIHVINKNVDQNVDKNKQKNEDSKAKSILEKQYPSKSMSSVTELDNFDDDIVELNALVCGFAKTFLNDTDQQKDVITTLQENKVKPIDGVDTKIQFDYSNDNESAKIDKNAPTPTENNGMDKNITKTVKKDKEKKTAKKEEVVKKKAEKKKTEKKETILLNTDKITAVGSLFSHTYDENDSSEVWQTCTGRRNRTVTPKQEEANNILSANVSSKDLKKNDDVRNMTNEIRSEINFVDQNKKSDKIVDQRKPKNNTEKNHPSACHNEPKEKVGKSKIVESMISKKHENGSMEKHEEESTNTEEWKCIVGPRNRTFTPRQDEMNFWDEYILSPAKVKSDVPVLRKGSDVQQRFTPKERAAQMKNDEIISNKKLPATNGNWNDKMVVSYCGRNNVLYMIRGLPGCGKTTIATMIKKLHPEGDAHICSGGHVRYINLGNGQYEQDPTALMIQQSACLEEARHQLDIGKNIIIIDNIHLRYEDTREYFKLAHNNDYIVNIIEPDFGIDIETCFNRNSYHVPKEALAEMKSTYEKVIAYYYGWTISMLDTFDLRSSICMKLQSHLTDMVAFREFLFKQNIQKIDNLFYVYHLKASSSSKNLTHITACYTNCGRRQGARSYSFKVDHALGRLDNIQIIGICMTPHCLFARVILNEKQKALWGDNDAQNGENNKLYEACQLCDLDETSNCANEKNSNVSKIYSFIQNMGDYLLPDFGVGCTAHITLGIVNGFQPVTSKLHLQKIITAEMNERPRYQYMFPNEMIRCYGYDNFWVMYFKESIVIPAMFCGTYYSYRFN